MSTVTIRIEYKLLNSEQWHSVIFSPNEYFDLDSDEEIEWDCVPIHNHAVDYLDVDYSLIQYTKSTIVDSKLSVTCITTETFWNSGKNRIIIFNVFSSTPFRQTIIECQIKNNPPTWEILRYREENNFSILSYHGLIIDKEDGSQDEQIIYQD